MPRRLFGTKNACVEDLDTRDRNTSTVVRVAECCTHARTIDDCNPKIWRSQGMLCCFYCGGYSLSQIDAAAFYGTFMMARMTHMYMHVHVHVQFLWWQALYCYYVTGGSEMDSRKHATLHLYRN